MWTRHHRSFSNPESMTTLKTCIASCTLKEITSSEIATPSMNDTQGKIVRGTLKKTVRKKKKTTTKTKDSKNLGDSSSDLRWGPRFQKQTSRKASPTNHHGSRTVYSKLSAPSIKQPGEINPELPAKGN